MQRLYKIKQFLTLLWLLIIYLKGDLLLLLQL